MRSKNFSIEFLRVVFTLYIVMRHSLAAAGVFCDNCLWLGVEFFFVLSGFFLAMTFSPDKDLLVHVRNQYVRFVPLTVWGCLLCAVIVRPDFLSFVTNALLLSETGLVVQGGASNPPTWYLSVLVWGGLLYALLFKYCRAKYFILALIVLTGLSLLRKHGYEPINGEIVIAGISHRFVRGVVVMGVGCVAALLMRRGVLTALHREMLGVIEIVVFCVAIIGPFMPIWHLPGCITLLVLNDALLVACFMSKVGVLSRWLDSPIWGRVSQYALALFCTHYVSTFAIERWSVQDASLSVRTFMVVCAICGSVAIAVVSRKFIEVPCARFLRIRVFNEQEVIK